MTAEPPQPDSSPPPRRARWWKYALRCVGLVLFVVALRSVDLGRVWRSLHQIPAVYVVAAAALCLAVICVKALRWHVLLGGLRLREGCVTSLLIYGHALFWGVITPGRLGEFRKIEHLHRRHGVTWGRGIVISLVDRLFDLVAVVIVFSLAASFLPAEGRDRLLPLPLVIVPVAIVALTIFRRWWLRPVVAGLTRLSRRAGGFAGKVTGDLLSLSVPRTIAALLLSLVSLSLYASMVFVLPLDLPFELSFSQAALCVAAAMLAGMVPISYFNLGSRLLVLMGLFRLFGRTGDEAVSLEFVFVLCYVLLMAETTVFWMLGRRQYRGSIRRAARAGKRRLE